MDNGDIIESIKGGLIVSCQALEHEPLHGSETMAKMAKAAEIGGAVGIRANTVDDIKEIKRATKLPIIGIIKKEYLGYEPYITPSMQEVESLIEVGADIIAIDATKRMRPSNLTASQFIKLIKSTYKTLVMADISVYEEGIEAQGSGADMVSTTLSGYTGYSPRISCPDFELIEKLSTSLKVPVIAEGRIWTPEEAGKCLAVGAYAVVVGGAITRPQLITQRFVEYIKTARDT